MACYFLIGRAERVKHASAKAITRVALPTGTRISFCSPEQLAVFALTLTVWGINRPRQCLLIGLGEVSVFPCHCVEGLELRGDLFRKLRELTIHWPFASPKSTGKSGFVRDSSHTAQSLF